MEERQRIYCLRSAGAPPPWTEDPILRNYRFTNVYREQDRVTVWTRRNWREPYADHSNLWFAMCIARQINWPPTLEHLGFPKRWNPDRYWKRMQECYERGGKVYTSAYMLRSDQCSNPGSSYANKGQYTICGILNPLWESLHGKANKGLFQCLEGSCETLKAHPGWGGFTAYEAVTDMRHTRYLNQAPDIMTWANPGPGAKRGLNRLYERSVKQSLPDQQAVEEMRMVLVWLTGHCDSSVLKTLEMRDVEMSLCEVDKYWRVKETPTGHHGIERFRPQRGELF